MLKPKQSPTDEVAEDAGAFVCSNCDGTKYYEGLDGDLFCLHCSRPNAKRQEQMSSDRPGRTKSLVKSARCHIAIYDGTFRKFQGIRLIVRLRNYRLQRLDDWDMECPYCGVMVTLELRGKSTGGERRWRLRCYDGHTVTIGPDVDGLPTRWWEYPNLNEGQHGKRNGHTSQEDES